MTGPYKLFFFIKMKIITWLYVVIDIVIIQCLINISDCYVSHLNYDNGPKNIRNDKFQNRFGGEDKFFHVSDTEYTSLNLNKEKRLQGTRKDSIVKERILGPSYFFPIFPQFHDVDYNDVINWIKDTDTIIMFVAVHILEVSKNSMAK